MSIRRPGQSTWTFGEGKRASVPGGRAGRSRPHPKGGATAATRIELHFRQCPGDTLVATAALWCLHQQHPGQFITCVSGNDAEPIFRYNPFVSPHVCGKRIVMECPLIHVSGQRPVHYLASYVDHLARELSLPLDLTINRPLLFFGPGEKSVVPVDRYWLVCSGGKTDYTVKIWPHYQDVVDRLQGVVQFVQVGSAAHKPLRGAINMLGKTSVRELLVAARYADGGLGAVSFLHHVFGALQKPFVCVASGFEATSWERYNTETWVSKAQCFPCSNNGNGCWKARVVPLPDDDEKNNSLCALPVYTPDPVPACMAAITPEEVAQAVKDFVKHRRSG